MAQSGHLQTIGTASPGGSHQSLANILDLNIYRSASFS